MRRGGWPAGKGEMARLVRTHDWAATPLGPVERWPQSLRTVVDTLLASGFPAIALWGPELVQVYNDGYRRIMAAKHPEGLGQPTRECWPEIWHINEPIYERVRSGETLTFEDKLFPITRHGYLKDAWFTLSYSPLRDEGGGIAGVLVTVFETTEPHSADAALKESEARYRAFVTASSDVVYRMGPDWDEMRQLDGRGFISDTAEPTENWMERYIHHDDRALVKAAIGEAVRTKGVFELEHRVVRADGTPGWTLSRAVPILGAGGEVLEWLGTASDVTARKEAEEALREGEERRAFLLKLSDVLRPLRDPVAIQEQASRILGENLAVDRCGYCKVGESATWITCHRDYHAPGMPSFAGTYRVDDFGKSIVDPLRTGETVAIDDGAEHPAFAAADTRAVVGAPLVKEGALVAIFFVHHRQPRHWTQPEVALIEEVAERTWEAVERARAEEALRESEEKYRTLFTSIDEGFCTIEVLLDEQGEAFDYRFLETNPAFVRQTGLQNAVGKTVRELVPQHEGFWFEVYGRIARTGEAMRFEHEAAALGRFYDVYAFRIGKPQEKRLAIIFNDILARKRAEEERERLRALEASAHAEAAERERISRELHDRVAHHMGVAHQSLELHAALAGAAPERAAEKLRLARETTRVALDQTRALSAELKRLQEEELEDGLGTAFRALADSYVPDAIGVDVRVSEKESAIPNHVALQAYLAMREAVRNAVRHSGCSRIGITLDVTDGEFVGSVEDDGSGFDPKSVGGATPSWGVGLHSMRERAEMLGGELRVDSRPRTGTKVEVIVPLDGRRP